MQFTPLQIKEKLQRALDDQNNVVDAAAVLEVISILENYPITREALEQTRIGKCINELRKKTTNDQLARRAKKLVRSWHKLINADTEGGSLNGERVITPPLHRGVAALQAGGNGTSKPISPALSRGGQVSSPKLAGKPCMSPAVSSSKPLTPGKPLTPQMTKVSTGARNSPALSGGRPATPILQSSHLSPGLRSSPSSTPNTPLSSSQQSSRHSPSGKPVQALSVGKSATISHQQTGLQLSPGLSNNSHSSPGLSHMNPGRDSSPRAIVNLRDTNSPKSHSPKLERSSTPIEGRPSTPCGRLNPSSVSSTRPYTPSNNEDSNSSWPNTPLSGQSLGKEKNNSNVRGKSKAESSVSVSGFHRDSSGRFSRKSNHSTEFSATESSDNGSRKDQSDISKTNVANRKRTRTKSPNRVPKKQPKTEDSSLSKRSKDSVVNGVMGSQKHRKGDKSDPSRSNSATSLIYSKGVGKLRPVSPGEKLDASLQNQSKPNSKSDASKTPKAPKVKTTAELIAAMQNRTGSSNYGNNIIEKLKSNQIEKEDDAPCSVLPPGVKPRKKRGNSMSSENLALLDVPSSMSLSQTKTEMVEKFLESSVQPSVSDELSPYKDDSLHKCESPMDSTNSFGDAHNDSLGDSKSLEQLKIDADNSNSEVKTENGITSSPTEKQLSVEEIMRLLPPVDEDSINWDAYEYSLGEPVTGDDETIERLHSSEWLNVNGCFDLDGVWHNWSQTLSRTSYGGDLLHILPYVNVDD